MHTTATIAVLASFATSLLAQGDSVGYFLEFKDGACSSNQLFKSATVKSGDEGDVSYEAYSIQAHMDTCDCGWLCG